MSNLYDCNGDQAFFNGIDDSIITLPDPVTDFVRYPFAFVVGQFPIARRTRVVFQRVNSSDDFLAQYFGYLSNFLLSFIQNDNLITHQISEFAMYSATNSSKGRLLSFSLVMASLASIQSS